MTNAYVTERREIDVSRHLEHYYTRPFGLDRFAKRSGTFRVEIRDLDDACFWGLQMSAAAGGRLHAEASVGARYDRKHVVGRCL